MDGDRKETHRRKPKQAVVVVHGMGEQRTMATLRSFVAAVCNVDPVTSDRPQEPFHIIPEQAAGISDLARIRVSTPPEGDPDMRTDFYEFYYADLLGGTTLGHLQAWVQGLLFRWPHQVPRGLAGLWVTLWAVTLFLVWWIGQEFDGKVFERLTEFATSGLKSDAQPPTVLQGLLLAFAMTALAWKLLTMAVRHVDHRETAPNPVRTHRPVWSYLLAVAAPLVLFGVFWNILPWEKLRWMAPAECHQTGVAWTCLAIAFINQVWIKLLVAAAVWWSVTKFGVAYFGDVARYLRMSPDAIQSREAIRNRGIALLTALQAKRIIKDGKPTEHPEYDRIVLVAHSLGSVIAYDVLRILWARDNANANQALPVQAIESMEKIVGLPGQQSGRGFSGRQNPVFPVYRFIELQKLVSRALCQEPQGWRISDFITLGSPLARADFLLARDWPRFAQAAGERSFPLCPPLLESSNGSFLYSGGTIPGMAPHHAAMFSAIRWTAFFDPYRYPMNGDFIGGPVSPLFGPGITDIPVRISRKRWWLASLFTHTEYWNRSVRAEATNRDRLQPDLDVNNLTETQEALALLRRLIWPPAE